MEFKKGDTVKFSSVNFSGQKTGFIWNDNSTGIVLCRLRHKERYKQNGINMLNNVYVDVVDLHSCKKILIEKSFLENM